MSRMVDNWALNNPFKDLMGKLDAVPAAVRHRDDINISLGALVERMKDLHCQVEIAEQHHIVEMAKQDAARAEARIRELKGPDVQPPF